MQWEQLSFVSPGFPSLSESFDPHSNHKRDIFSENVDPDLLPANYIQRIAETQPAPARQRVLERILEKICESDLPGKQHVEQYLRHKYRRNCKVNTLKSSAASLMQFLSFFRTSGRKQLEQLSREDFEPFVEDLQDRGLMPETVRTRLCAVYAFMHYLIKNKVFSYELLEHRIRLKMPDRLPRAIDPQDVTLFLSVINAVRDRAMILLLLRTGMRIGELLNCKVDDVDLKQQRILIYQSDKTSVGRVVYFSNDAQEALLAWLRLRDPLKELLFYGQGRQSMCYEAARSMFNKYLQRAGLENRGYTLHCLRHTFATELLNARMPLECLRVLLGHTNLEVTRRYARLSDKTREQEYFNAMERILKGGLNADDKCDHQF
jgi:integrase/recombinase XerD